MGKEDSMTPQLLICAFRDKRFDTSREAIVAFRKLEPSLQKKFLQPIIDFLKSEEHDNIRGWGTSVLESIGNAKAFEYLNTLLTSADDDQKKRYPWTRFFALRAIRRIAKKSSHEMVSKLLKEIENSPDENLLVSTEATIIRALDGNEKSEREMRDLLDKLLSKGVHRMNYYKCFCIVRGLQEFALPGLVNSIMDIAANCDIPDLQNRAVRALGGYKDHPEVVRVLGNVVRFNPYPSVRLSAVESLEKIGNVEAKEDLLTALLDSDAEVRFQASQVLREPFLPIEDTVSMIVERALREEAKDEKRNCYYIEALRRIDPDRKVCTDTLGTELGSEDRERSKKAEKILIELGGWAAIQKVNQLRSTLEALDKMLANSEEVVKATFDRTVSQAHFNFYFAMVINGLLVGLGIILVSLAINQVILSPENLTDWIVPGGAGIFGILASMFFNNPRKNARDDLRALMNVTVIFLGFLRQLNEIDATFKHAYISGGVEFGTDEMRETVSQIDQAMQQTLKMASQHLRIERSPIEPEKPAMPETPPATSDQ